MIASHGTFREYLAPGVVPMVVPKILLVKTPTYVLPNFCPTGCNVNVLAHNIPPSGGLGSDNESCRLKLTANSHLAVMSTYQPTILTNLLHGISNTMRTTAAASGSMPNKHFTLAAAATYLPITYSLKRTGH